MGLVGGRNDCGASRYKRKPVILLDGLVLRIRLCTRGVRSIVTRHLFCTSAREWRKWRKVGKLGKQRGCVERTQAEPRVAPGRWSVLKGHGYTRAAIETVQEGG